NFCHQRSCGQPENLVQRFAHLVLVGRVKGEVEYSTGRPEHKGDRERLGFLHFRLMAHGTPYCLSMEQGPGEVKAKVESSLLCSATYFMVSFLRFLAQSRR